MSCAACRDVAIATIQECRQTHVDWAALQAADASWGLIEGTRDEVGGDREHHERWVRNYDVVLAVLRGECVCEAR
ncbi:MAG TPA: hypothetical protein VM204_03440 [Gaiellaceae bacterium]|nr:hypothetical protein [Gaiellaceae bacterium]